MHRAFGIAINRTSWSLISRRVLLRWCHEHILEKVVMDTEIKRMWWECNVKNNNRNDEKYLTVLTRSLALSWIVPPELVTMSKCTFDVRLLLFLSLPLYWWFQDQDDSSCCRSCWVGIVYSERLALLFFSAFVFMLDDLHLPALKSALSCSTLSQVK